MNSNIFLLVQRGVGWNIVRTIFCSLDWVFFKLFQFVLQGAFDIANVQLLQEETFVEFQDRVYVILGIFMLFKLTVSMLNYLVNPDKLADKEAGLGKMVSRTVITLCMLAGFPKAFNLLYSSQNTILEAVPRIIIGKKMTSTDSANQMEATANKITWTIYSIAYNQNGNQVTEFNNMDAALEHVNDHTDDNSVYKYDYTILIGALIAAAMTFIMLGMCIDIAIRVFKLVILRMIAPIPIISYINPKSAKDGAFSNWTKALLSTWLDLFIKMGILYFVIYMIDLVVLQGILQGQLNLGVTGYRKLVVIIFIIIGLLFFARQAPKFITDALGIKSSKGLGVGFGGALAAGGALLGGAGLAGALGAGASYANEAADAAAQGKAAGPAFSKGRDLAAQLRTGDKNAKGGLTNRFGEYLSDHANNARANRLGLSASNVSDLKKNMYDKETELARARDAVSSYEQAVQNGQAKYDADVMKKLQDNVIQANQNYGKAQSAYNDAKAARESIVGKNRTSDDYSTRRGGTYRARLNAGPDGFERKATSRGAVAYKDLQDVSIPAAEKQKEEKAPEKYEPITPMTEDSNTTYMAGSGDNTFTREQSAAEDQAEEMYNNIFDNQRDDN